MSRTEGQQLSGTVKYYSLEKGYGFITCDDEGGDCFVHQSSIITDAFRALIKGHKVTFSYTNKQGKDTATDVQPNPPVHYATRLDAKKASFTANRDPDVLDGTIKWFNFKKGFGFIIPKVGEQEVFVHIGQVEGQVALTEGDEVEYKVTVDEKQKSCATGVRLTSRNGQPIQSGGVLLPQPGMGLMPQMGLLSQMPQMGLVQPAPQPVQTMMAPGQQSGTVKWFNESKGFGFITTPMGTDVYVNKPHLGMVGGSLTQGETVIFETRTSDGKTWAANVTRGDSHAPVAQYLQPQQGYSQPQLQAQPSYLQQAPQLQQAYAQQAPQQGYAPQPTPQQGGYLPQQQPQYEPYAYIQQAPVQSELYGAAPVLVGAKRKMAEAPVAYARETARPKYY